MASLGPRATPTTSRVVVLALGVLLVEAGGDQGHPSQKMNKILRRELKRDSRWSSTPSYAESFFLQFDFSPQVVLLVSNIPPNLANPDSLFYAFEKFGSVVRVKILHNKRNTALIQVLRDSCFGKEATTCFSRCPVTRRRSKQ